jgi:hypothetical protein
MIISSLYFRITPFLFGIALAIMKFEYKYVDKLNDGNKPFHKVYLEQNMDKKHFFKVCYFLGTILFTTPVLILLGDTYCVNNDADI